MRVSAMDFNNLLRVDDDNNEIVVTVKDKISSGDENQLEITQKPTRQDLLMMLDEMSKTIDALPSHAKIHPINHYDFGSLLSLLSLILKN